ncbi:hypothetical protein WN944_013544 [Citrus x changshan-huyou]|uniref:Uncharacterized protein n=1 Tax=Citrus x changshan-huyou TaxID=2935761 RepID=A0AAP0MAG7_9ROSI
MKSEPRTVVGRDQEEEGECVVCGLGEPHDHEDDELLSTGTINQSRHDWREDVGREIVVARESDFVIS